MTVPALSSSFPTTGWAIPSSTVSADRYLLRFARTDGDLDRVLRLRHEVYHVEYGIGVGALGRDREEDELDLRLHHVMVEERESRAVVGTYRMQTAEMAAADGFASGELFDLASLPRSVLDGSVEVGRACIARNHRNSRVLELLWRGVASYLARNQKTIAFGSCGVPSLDDSVAGSLHRHFAATGAVHPALRVEPWPETACTGSADASGIGSTAPRVPELFQAYLDLGAKLLGPPAQDRAFKTTNWLLLVDANELGQQTLRTFFR